MGTNSFPQVAYGLSQSLLEVFPLPIVSKRNPTTADKAQIGTSWVNTTTDTIYFLVGIANNQATWVSAGGSGGAGVFASVEATTGNITADLGNIVATAGTVTAGTGLVATTGGISSTGAVTLNGGVVNIGSDAAANNINIGTGAAAKTITIGNSTGATAINVNSGTGDIHIGTNATDHDIIIGSSNGVSGLGLVAGTGGLVLTTGGLMAVQNYGTQTAASPIATVLIDTNIGYATFTGFTTAAGSSQVFTIGNSLVTATTPIFVTAANLGSNDAQMTVTRVVPGASTFDVTVKNNGAAALNGDVTITFWTLN